MYKCTKDPVGEGEQGVAVIQCIAYESLSGREDTIKVKKKKGRQLETILRQLRCFIEADRNGARGRNMMRMQQCVVHVSFCEYS